MVSLFISHSSVDNAAVRRVLSRLQAYGYQSFFLDIDPQHGIAAGRRWEAELHTQLRRADAVVFLASPASVGSLWCTAEITLARTLGKPIFPVQISPGAQHAMLADLQSTDLCGDNDPGYLRLVAGLQRAGVDPGDSFAWDSLRSPYPGLDAYAGRDAAVFFGRAAETTTLVSVLQPAAGRSRGEFVAVVGPSGSGKSSLIRAGLLPRLARQARWRVLPPLVPGERPLAQLARSLATGLYEVGIRRDAADVEAQLRHDPQALRELAARFSYGADAEQPPWVVLFVDQAEELVTRSTPAEGAAFLRLLGGGLHPESPLWIVATVRSDFLTTIVDRAGGAEVFDHTVLVGPLSRSRLPEVVEAPARRSGVTFEPGLVPRIVDDTGGGDALPLLAYTLRQLYDAAAADGVITHLEYDAAGGVAGALQRQADRVLAELTRRHRREDVLDTLLQLVSVQPGGAVVRRSLPTSELTPAQFDIVSTLVNARLLRASEGDSRPTVEVSHEALLRTWEPLRTAIDESRRVLQIRSDLEQTARAWMESGHEASYLPRGVFLDAAARTIPVAGIVPTSGPVPEFLAASRHYSERELRKTRRSNRRLRILAAAMALVVVVAGATAVFAMGQQREASRQQAVAGLERSNATAQKLLALARSTADADPETSLKLGIAANAIAATTEAKAELIKLASRNHFAGTLGFHTDSVAAIVAHPSLTQVIATGGWDQRIALWDVSNPAAPTRLAALEGTSSFVNQLAFSPDGRLLASAQSDGRVVLYDTSDLSKIVEASGWTAHTGTVFDLAFRADGKVLATAGEDKLVQLWDVADRAKARRIARLTGHTGEVRTLAFHPSGTVLASGSLDQTVRFWDVADATAPRVRYQLTKLGDSVAAVSFSPDGATLAVGGYPRLLRVYGYRGATPPVLQAEPPASAELAGDVGTLSFSPDGSQLAVGAGRELIVYNRYSDQLRHVFTAEVGGFALATSFLDGGRRVASGGYFGKASLWNVTSPAEPSRPRELIVDDQDPQEVAFVNSDRRLATLSRNGRVMVWQPGWDKALFATGPGYSGLAANQPKNLLASGAGDRSVVLWTVSPDGRLERVAAIPGHPAGILVVAISADGTRLASGDKDGTVLVSDISDPRKPRVLSRLTDLGAVRALAFSTDGNRLATGGTDREVGLYDISDASAPELRFTGLGQSLAITALAVSPDGRWLVSGSADSSIVIFNVADPGRARVLSNLTEHTGTVYGLAFSPDGQTLASVSGDSTARLWDFTDPERPAPVGTLGLLGWGGYGLAFSAKGRSLATAAEGANLWLWDLGGRLRMQADPVRQACAIVGRGLSEEQWRGYAPGIPYRASCP